MLEGRLARFTPSSFDWIRHQGVMVSERGLRVQKIWWQTCSSFFWDVFGRGFDSRHLHHSLLLAALLSFCVSAAFVYLRNIYLDKTRFLALSRTRNKYFGALIESKLALIEETSHGEFINEIVTELERYALSKKAVTITLNARENAISFYLSLGYSEVCPYQSDTGIPHKTMKKSLSY